MSPLYREANEDYLIPGTKIIIEKGTRVLISSHGIHHDPEYYPDPEKFDPDRFAKEEKVKRDPITFIPFGHGPRNCVALRLGMMQIRIGLVAMINNFQFSIGTRTPVPVHIDEKAYSRTPVGGCMYLKLKAIVPL